MLHIVERIKILLLTEHRARLTEDGGMAEAGTAPEDGLLRVFVGEVLRTREDGPIVIPPFHSDVQLCMQALQALCEPEDILWCFGEADWRNQPLDEAFPGDGVRHAPATGFPWERFFIFPLIIPFDRELDCWPGLRNERSLNVIAIRDRNCRIHQTLTTTYTQIEHDPNAVQETFESLIDLRFSRSALMELLAEAPIVLVPDGNHNQFPTFYSRRIAVETIVRTFEDLARAEGCAFSTQENSDVDYFDFFREGASLVRE